MPPIRPLKVLLLPIRKLFSPWCDDVVSIVGARHELAVFDDSAPIANQFAGVEAVIDHGGHVGTHEMMDAATGALLWQLMTIGYEHVDIEYLRRRGLSVANVPGSTSAASLAETALMFILMLSHRVRECASNFEARVWLEPPGREVEGMTLLIVGLGHSGRCLAKRASALGMRVVGVNRTAPDEQTMRASCLDECHGLDALDELLPHADVVSLHVAVAESTRRIIDARRLGLMKRSALLINVARGALVEEPALYEVLQAGHLGGAGLDVFDTEPPDVAHPVFDLPNVVVTPHVGAFTDGSSRKRAEFMAGNIDRVAQAAAPLCRVG
jgi:phosphoglycerate dehydrogenase-like enzyme